MYFREPKTNDEASTLKRVLNLLGLNPDEREFRIVHGYLSETDAEIAMLSRSMMQIMSDYASYIEVPDADIKEGRVYGAEAEKGETGIGFQPLIRVHCRASKPDDAFVAVSYRNH
jgi:hypothetical protein